MFKVGDVVKVINGRRGDRYKVIYIHQDGGLLLRNVTQTEESMNFRAYTSDNLVIDETYYRKQKIEKIMDNIDSFNIMDKAKHLANENREWERLMLMESRKMKIKKICSK